jgi:hypothetical protein
MFSVPGSLGFVVYIKKSRTNLDFLILKSRIKSQLPTPLERTISTLCTKLQLFELIY